MTRPDRIRLVVLFGGQSAEHEVSCTTAAHVLRAVDPDRYDLVPVGITRDGTWVRADDAQAALARGATALPAPPDRLEATGTAVEPLRTVMPSADDLPVVVLPLLHGPHGEDGTVQGLLELAGVPYVGSGVLASALAMDKVKAKEVLGVHRLPQVAWVAMRDTQIDDAADALARAQLTYPVFVKPANLGSSVGVTKVHAPSELDEAVALAATYDEWILIEEGVDAREIEVAVLGNAAPRASVPGEIVSSHEFYDYDDKYVDGTCQLLVPAPLDEAVAGRVRALAIDAYRALRCEGMARVDFFYEADGRGFLVNEVNTIPGFTPVSMYPKLWEASGLSYPDLIDELVRLAVERHDHRSRFSTKR
ncbi:MAG TPA: D-alanine--D-alanine ligase family protein [Acidimicrobiales bacterium]